jgi:Domain of unknown function (DUF1871)
MTKADYKLALQVIREWDPYSLLASGSPSDEFDSEIARVVVQIPRIKSERDATSALSRTFSSSFEAELFSPADCAAAGAMLLAALDGHGLIV